MHRMIFALVCAGAALLAAGSSTAGPPIPPTVAVVGKGAKRMLVRVDARTLEPILGSARIRLPRGAAFALSPNSRRAAIDTPKGLVIADTASGRVVEPTTDQGGDASLGIHWVGTNADPLVVEVGESEFGYEYTSVPSTLSTTDTDLEPVAAIRGFLVLFGEGKYVDFFGRDEIGASLDAAPTSSLGVVADVATGRVFVIFSAGVVAEVVGKTVTYHLVQLNGRDFHAIWAGHGQIALWGADGLGIIDTRTWLTHALAPAATGAVATRYGIVGWNANAIDGVSVYGADGLRNLHVLTNKEIENVTALGRYAYARTTEKKQYAIDLKTGRVSQVRANVELAVPTLVPIP